MSRRVLSIMLVVVMLVSFHFTSSVHAENPEKSQKYYHEFTEFRKGSHDGTVYDSKVLRLDVRNLKSGTDTTGRYNDGEYYYGQWTSPVVHKKYLETIASWKGNTPEGTWLEVELRGKVHGEWTKWYSVGVWHENDVPFKRHSIRGQGDDHGSVYVDTFVLKEEASAIQARVTLFTTERNTTPVLRGLGLSLTKGKDSPGLKPHTGVVKALDVPMRSQMVFPDGGEVWCSPTSTSMVMAYWAEKLNKPEWNQPVPAVVGKVWDYVYNGAGNWPFNTAYAASTGLDAKVVRFRSLAEVEKWINADVPVIVSIAYKKGELRGTPIEQSNGHILVIRGFDSDGNVLTNDPAGATDEDVRITYDRYEFEKVFLNHSNGTAYLIYPEGWKVPNLNGSW